MLSAINAVKQILNEVVACTVTDNKIYIYNHMCNLF